LLLNLHQSYIEGLKSNQINYKNLYLKKEFYIYLKIDMFYLNQFLHNFSNLILIIFKRIETVYLYVYQTNKFLKISHMKCFLCFIVI